MPELPEVETVRLSLEPVIGHGIAGVWGSGKKLRSRNVRLRALREASVGRSISSLRRIGKYLLLDLSGDEHSILVHLGMSGRLRLIAREREREKHTHLVFTLSESCQYELRFSDPRRFGQVNLLKSGEERLHPSLAKLGLDPLLDGGLAAHFSDRIRKSKRTVKALLLDQSILTGIGNIYAAEALFRACIHPGIRGHRLGRRRASALAEAARETIEEALTRGGTSLRDFVAADGSEGVNAPYLDVYGRKGLPCRRFRCGGTIKSRLDQGRTTFYCPTCQSDSRWPSRRRCGTVAARGLGWLKVRLLTLRDAADEVLMVQYQQGDARAFEVLLLRHQKPIFNFLLRSVGRRDIAEDLLQETFLRVIKGAANYKQQAKFTTWLYTIARNLCVDQSRRAKHRKHPSLDQPLSSREEAGSLMDVIPSTGEASDRSAINKQMFAAIETAVTALSADQREVFLLREFQDLPFKDIAKIVGVSENTVKSRMRYALAKLRDALAEYEDLARMVPA